MKPIGLTLKLGRNKYRSGSGGELMLIHQCVDCGSLSINRIAADDDAGTLLEVFESSLNLQIHTFCEVNGIAALRSADSAVLHKQLFGGKKTPVPAW
jgi:hypothetical protein